MCHHCHVSTTLFDILTLSIDSQSTNGCKCWLFSRNCWDNRKLTEIPTKFINTSQMEAYCGVIQFISCLYVLPVVPYQMKRVGYDETGSIIATTVCCAIGSIIAAFLTDMPFIVAPPTSVSIFLAVSMQQQGLVKDAGESYYSDYIRVSTIVEFLQILSNKLLLFSIFEK